MSKINTPAQKASSRNFISQTFQLGSHKVQNESSRKEQRLFSNPSPSSKSTLARPNQLKDGSKQNSRVISDHQSKSNFFAEEKMKLYSQKASRNHLLSGQTRNGYQTNMLFGSTPKAQQMRKSQIVSKKDLYEVMNSPKLFHLNSSRNNQMNKQLWQSSSQTRLKLYNNNGKIIAGQSEYLKGFGKNFDDRTHHKSAVGACDDRETMSRTQISNVTSPRNMFNVNKSHSFRPSKSVQSQDLTTRSSVYQNKVKMDAKTKAQFQKRDYLRQQMSYFHKYLTPAQKLNILVTQKNQKYNKKGNQQQVPRQSQNSVLPNIQSGMKSVFESRLNSNRKRSQDSSDSSSPRDMTASQQSPSKALATQPSVARQRPSPLRQSSVMFEKISQEDAETRNEALGRSSSISKKKSLQERRVQLLKVKIDEVGGMDLPPSSVIRSSTVTNKGANVNKKSSLRNDKSEKVQSPLSQNNMSELSNLGEQEEEVVYDPQSTNPMESFKQQQDSVKHKYLLHFENMKDLNQQLDEQIERQRGSTCAQVNCSHGKADQMSFEYLNPLVQDKNDLFSQSGGLSLLYRQSTRGVSMKSLKHQITKRNSIKKIMTQKTAIASEDLESVKEADEPPKCKARQQFNLSAIMDYYQNKEVCAVRTDIQKLYLKEKNEHTEAEQKEMCNHDLNEPQELTKNVHQLLSNYQVILDAKKHVKLDKKELFDRIQSTKNKSTEFNIRYISQPEKAGNHISVLDTNDDNDSKDEQAQLDLERQQYNEKVFQELTVTQKNLEQERQREQIKINNLEIGNAHSQGFINYGINNQIYMNQHAFQQLMTDEKQGLLQKQHGISESPSKKPNFKRFNEGTQALAETTQIGKTLNNIEFNIQIFKSDYSFIEETNKSLNKENLALLKKLQRKQSQEKLKRIEEKQKFAAQAIYSNKAKPEKVPKTNADIVQKAFAKSLADQQNENEVYMQDHKSMHVTGLLREQEQIFQEKLNKTQYYQDLKKGVTNPEIVGSLQMNYYTDLVNQKYNGSTIQDKQEIEPRPSHIEKKCGKLSKGTLCMKLPHFNNLKNGNLMLINRQMLPSECQALSNFIKQAVDPKQTHDRIQSAMIRVVLIDESNFTDAMFANILESVHAQGVTSATTNPYFGRYTSIKQQKDFVLEQLIYMNGEIGESSARILTEQLFAKQQNFRQLSLSNIKNQAHNQKYINQIMQAIEEGPAKIKKLKFSRMTINDSVFFDSLKDCMYKLVDIDLSWTTIKSSQIAELSKSFINSGYLKSINLSYINMLDISHLRAKGNHINNFVDDMVELVQTSTKLMHLNLNGLELSEQQVLKLIRNGIAKSRTLIGVHLSGNGIKEGSDLRQQVFQALAIKQVGSAACSENLGLDSQNKKLSTTQLVKTSLFQIDVVNQEILNLFKQDKTIHEANSSTWSGGGNHPGARTSTRHAPNSLDTCFVIYRHVGHHELIFEGLQHGSKYFDPSFSNENWRVSTNPQDGINDVCYFCENHKYVQVFYKREERYTKYELIEDGKYKDKLRKMYSLEINQAKESSYKNPLLITSFKGHNDWCAYPMANVKYIAAYILQTLVFESNQAHKNLPFLKKHMRKELIYLIQGTRDKYEQQQKLKDYLDRHMINWRSTFAQYLKYTSQYDCQKIGYPYNTKEYPEKPYTAEQLVDDDAQMESSESSSEDSEDDESCDQQSQENDTERILQRPQEGVTFVYMNFVKPGCHAIIIYDPETHEFFKKTVLVKYRSDDPKPFQAGLYKADRTQAESGCNSLASLTDSGSQENGHSKAAERPAPQEEKDHYSVKISQPERIQFLGTNENHVLENLCQQPDFAQEIFEEDIIAIKIKQFVLNKAADEASISSETPTEQCSLVTEPEHADDTGDCRHEHQQFLGEQAPQKILKQIDALKQNFSFIVNLFQYLELRKHLVQFLRVYTGDEEVLEDDQEGKIHRIEFVNILLENSYECKNIEQMLQRVKSHMDINVRKFILFRQALMSPLKQTLWRTLNNNQHILNLLWQIYSPENHKILTKEDQKKVLDQFTPVAFLNDLEQMTVEMREDSDSNEQSFLQKLEEEYFLTPEQLTHYCLTVTSFKNDNITHMCYERPSGERNPEYELKKMEFTELICRVAFVMELSIWRFIEDYLLDLIDMKHKQIWEGVRNNHEAQERKDKIHQIVPFSLEPVQFIDNEMLNQGLGGGRSRRSNSKQQPKVKSSGSSKRPSPGVKTPTESQQQAKRGARRQQILFTKDIAQPGQAALQAQGLRMGIANPNGTVGNYTEIKSHHEWYHQNVYPQNQQTSAMLQDIKQESGEESNEESEYMDV